MKNFIRNACISLFFVMPAITLNAQDQRNGYFLERYAYRWQLNPALLNDWGFLSLTPLAHWGIDVHSNIGISDFLYSKDGKLYTFLDKNSISVKELDSKLSHVNQLRTKMSFNVLSFGFFAWGGYNVFGIDFTNDLRVNLPKDLLMMPKQNLGRNYNLSDIEIRNHAYTTISLGHARPLDFIDEKLTAGVTLKVFVGNAALRARTFDSYLNLNSDDRTNNYLGYKLNYEVMMSSVLNKTSFPQSIINADGTIKTGDLANYLTQDLNWGGSLGCGWGLGIDLGATYQILPKLTLSAALTDIGFIKWQGQLYARSNIDEYQFKGLDSIDAKLDNYLPSDDQINALGKIYPSTSNGYTTVLNANLRLGAEYSLHKYISFGLLSTTRFAGWATSTELMASANIKPKWFNLVLNAAISNWGSSWGFYLGWAPRYFVNFFMSVDYAPYVFAGTWGIPANNASISANLGASIPLNRNPRNAPKPEDMRSVGDLDIGGKGVEWRLDNNTKAAKKPAEQMLGIELINREEEKEAVKVSTPIEDVEESHLEANAKTAEETKEAAKSAERVLSIDTIDKEEEKEAVKINQPIEDNNK